MKKLRRIIGIILAIVSLVPSSVSAVTSFDVYDLPTLYLNVGISSTQSSAIYLAPPYLNGVAVAIPAMSGAIFEFSQNGKRENIYADSVHVNQSTYLITLTGITRDLCYNQKTSFTGCGNGQLFQKSATVLLTDDARIFNLKANVDRPNTFTAPQTFTGAVTITAPLIVSGSTSYVKVPSLTTAQRTAITCSNGMIVYDSTIGVMYQCVASAWSTFASGVTSNATESAAGKGELATIPDQIARTQTGDSGGPLILQPKYLTSSGTIHGRNNTLNAGKIIMLDASGSLATTIGGTGLTNPASGGLLLTSGSGVLRNIQPTNVATGSTVMAYQNRWLVRPPSYKLYGAITSVSSAVGHANTTAEATMVPTWTGTGGIIANALSAGSVVHLNFAGTVAVGAANLNIRVYIGGTEAISFQTATTTGAAFGYTCSIDIISLSSGASNSLLANGGCQMRTSSTVSVSIAGMNSAADNAPQTISKTTNVNRSIRLTAQYNTDNVSNSITVDSGYLSIANQ